MIASPALWVAVAAMTPLMVLTAWSDLKELKIPNQLVLGVLGTFLITGLWGLPLDVFAWRLGQGIVVLGIGFALFQLGVIGGGDAKMAAALAPFVVPRDLALVLVIYAVVTIAMLMVLRMAMHVFRHRETGWAAVDQQRGPARRRVFPMGLIFGVTIAIYLGLHSISALD